MSLELQRGDVDSDAIPLHVVYVLLFCVLAVLLVAVGIVITYTWYGKHRKRHKQVIYMYM